MLPTAAPTPCQRGGCGRHATTEAQALSSSTCAVETAAWSRVSVVVFTHSLTSGHDQQHNEDGSSPTVSDQARAGQDL